MRPARDVRPETRRPAEVGRGLGCRVPGLLARLNYRFGQLIGRSVFSVTMNVRVVRPEAAEREGGYVLACTHLVPAPFPHVAISLLTPGSFTTDESLRVAADAAAAGPAGRAVLFPGSTRLTGALTVSEILQRSSIARVEVLGSGPADPRTVVETGDFVRPQFRSGELVLVTTPAAGGRLTPFERRDPTPCCASH